MITRLGTYSQLKGVSVSGPCKVATTGPITLSGTQTIDTIPVSVGDRVLVKDQSPASDNGIYVVQSGPWTRAVDMSINDDVLQGLQIYINSGAVTGDKIYILNTPNPIILGTSNLSFVISVASVGTSGTSGTSGVSGSSGATGSGGTSGSSGIDGTSGSSGTAGTSGTSGTSGSSGTAGTSGTSGAGTISGTTNYASKFTGSTTLGNSQIYDNSVDIGINTTTPLTISDFTGLTINGTNGSFINFQGSGINGTFLSDDVNGTNLFENRNLALKLGTNSTTRFTIFAGGNVLIGPSASDAGYKLDVNGTARLTGALSGTTATFSGTINSTISGLIFSRAGASTLAQYFSLENTGNTTQFGIENSTGGGLVTGAPAYSTTLATVTNTSIVIAPNRVIAATFNNANTTLSGALTGTSATFSSLVKITGGTIAAGSELSLAWNATDGASIQSFSSKPLNLNPLGNNTILNSGGGNVGIGTASPVVKLTISSDATDADVGQLRVVGATSAAKILNIGYNTTNNYGFIQPLIAGTGYSPLSLNPNSGNVLIGTTTDAGYKLDVNGTGRFSGKITSTLGNNQLIFESSTATTGYQFVVLQNTSARLYYGIEGSTAGQLTTSNTAYSSTFGTLGTTDLFLATNQIARLKIDGSTGAATFSSSVTTSGDISIIKSSATLTINGGSSSNSGASVELLGWNSGAKNWRISTAELTGGLEFSSSTTNGGSTFTSNVALIDESTGVYTAISDRNKKKNLENYTGGLTNILDLKPTLYNMLDQDNQTAKELGFIAQDVKDVIPQAYIENGNFIGLNYNAIIPVLVNAIKEQQAQIEELKSKLN